MGYVVARRGGRRHSPAPARADLVDQRPLAVPREGAGARRERGLMREVSTTDAQPAERKTTTHPAQQSLATRSRRGGRPMNIRTTCRRGNLPLAALVAVAVLLSASAAASASIDRSGATQQAGA